MILTIEEKMWYDKFISIGLDSEEAELMARFKCLYDEFMVSRDVNWNSKEFINPYGPFFQFCIESGRLTSDEIRNLSQFAQSADNPFNQAVQHLLREALSLGISKAKKINMLNLIH